MKSLEQDIITSQLSSMGKALSNPLRWTLLSFLAQCEKPVQRLAEQTGHRVANISIQLRVLQEAGLVVSRREGRNVFYSLASPMVLEMLTCIQEAAKELHPGTRMVFEEFFRDEADISEAGIEGALEDVHAGRVHLIDLRQPDDFAESHLPGAINIPVGELREHLDLLHRSKMPVIVYCRGPYCVASVNGLRILRGAGISARRLALRPDESFENFSQRKELI